VAVHQLSEFTPGRAASIVREQEFGEVILVPESGQVPQALDLAFACLDTGAEATVLSPDLQHLANRGGADVYDRIPHLRLRRIDYAGPKTIFKRGFDIVSAGLGLLLLSPLLAAIALAVRLSSPGGVIYRQDRVGYKGRRFSMYKFRTMREGNDSSGYEEYVRSFIREGAAASVAEDGTKIYKPPRDSRVTGVGVWLRRLSLDELPQLWNVLKGDMSLVGPRPCLLYEWDLYDEWQKRRYDVTPGCTGLWQVRGRSRVQFHEMVVLDLYYAHHGTLGTDLKLILETLPVMLLGRGAY
jgi:lipopolysaccharide/colanic/teichoic acid biosynthesis glycosyltransferase